jgi:DNA-binding LacI/PurR family transcriptional regulator
MASILDVAREANVAASTVSLVLNHESRVSPETRERVKEVIAQLGYRPRGRQQKAESTSKPRENPKSRKQVALRVAFVYTLESMHDASMSVYCREIIKGIQDALKGTPSALSIIRGAEHVTKDIMFNQQLQSHEFDGIILFGPEPSNGYLEFLGETGIPLVVFNRFTSTGKYSCVTLDYYGGARSAVDHLVELGHTKIAVIHATINPNAYYFQNSAQGSEDAFKKHGLAPHFYGSFDGFQHADDIAGIVKDMLRSGATALTSGDRVISMATPYLIQAGVRVPEDFSLIGFDNLGLKYQGKAVTSVGYDRERMGRKAVHMLQRLVAHSQDVKWLATSIKTYIALGQTTAKPRA